MDFVCKIGKKYKPCDKKEIYLITPVLRVPVQQSIVRSRQRKRRHQQRLHLTSDQHPDSRLFQKLLRIKIKIKHSINKIAEG